MAPGLESLGDDGIGAGSLRRSCFGERRDGCEPRDALVFELRREVTGKEAHQGRCDSWFRVEDRLAMPLEILLRDVARRLGHFRSPSSKKLPHSFLLVRVPRLRGIRNPGIQVEHAVAAGT